MSDMPAKQPKSEREVPDLEQTAAPHKNGKLRKKLHPHRGAEHRNENHSDNGISVTGQDDDDVYRGAAHFYRQRNPDSCHDNIKDAKPLRIFKPSTIEKTCNGFLEETSEGIGVTTEQRSRSSASHGSDNQCDVLVSWHYVNGYGGHPNSPEEGVSTSKDGDDMENYFNANAHLLAYLDQQSRSIENETDVLKEVTSFSRCKDDQNELSSLGAASCQGCGNGGIKTNGIHMRQYAEPRSRPARLSIDSDQGDFIETDISVQYSRSGSYGTLQDSSDEGDEGLDMPALAPYGQCGHIGEEACRPNFLPGTRDLEITSSQDKCRCNLSDSCQVHGQGGGGKIRRTFRQSQPKGCDYKTIQTGICKPTSFNSASKHCQCSIVSYSRGRPVLHNNDSLSGSDDPLADEGLGLRVSPIEVSPVESDSGAPCGITVTSDSASYLSPEDVDFTDFEVDPDVSGPPDRSSVHDVGTGTATGVTGANFHDVNGCSLQNGAKSRCADCGNNLPTCLCASLQACKRLLESSQGVTGSAVSDRVGAQQQRNPAQRNRERQENGACMFCADTPGRDSGSGSQEHLDSLSCSDDPSDHTPPLQSNPTCMCRSHTYTGYEVANDQLKRGFQEEYGDDTNNLDVEAFSAAPSSDYEDELFNVSRQTSTSNFDQDENTYQDENAYQDAAEETPSNGFHSACSGSDGEERSDDMNHEEATNGHIHPSHPPNVPPIQDYKLPSGRNCQVGTSRDFNREIPVHHAGSGAREKREEGMARRDQGAKNRMVWPSQSDDESPIAAIPWPEYDFQSEEADLNRRRPLARPSWLHLSDDDSPVNAMRLLEHGFISPSVSSDADDNRQAGLSPEQLGYNDGGSARPPPPPPPPQPPPLPAQSRDNDRSTEEMEPNFPDPLTDIFILNLLREKESRGLCGGAPSRPSVEKVMIWSEYEAYVLQVKQMGSLACGATAVINVLKAFDIYVDKGAVVEAIVTNRRAETAQVAEYLLSRSTAGCTADHMTEGVERLTGGEIRGRFFCFYPERDVDICQWLGEWIKKGAVPLLTLNLQRAVPQGWDTPDAWHHQMAYGVGPKGVYLTNPLEIVPEEVVREQLTSSAVLLVLRHDVISRWSADTDLGLLLHQDDERWRHLNVLGQVVNVLREANMPRVLGFRPQLTSHVRIPSWHRPGVTLFVRHNSDTYRELMDAPELPVKQEVAASPGGRLEEGPPNHTLEERRTEPWGNGPTLEQSESPGHHRAPDVGPRTSQPMFQPNQLHQMSMPPIPTQPQQIPPRPTPPQQISPRPTQREAGLPPPIPAQPQQILLRPTQPQQIPTSPMQPQQISPMPEAFLPPAAGTQPERPHFPPRTTQMETGFSPPQELLQRPTQLQQIIPRSEAVTVPQQMLPPPIPAHPQQISLRPPQLQQILLRPPQPQAILPPAVPAQPQQIPTPPQQQLSPHRPQEQVPPPRRVQPQQIPEHPQQILAQPQQVEYENSNNPMDVVDT